MDYGNISQNLLDYSSEDGNGADNDDKDEVGDFSVVVATHKIDFTKEEINELSQTMGMLCTYQDYNRQFKCSNR